MRARRLGRRALSLLLECVLGMGIFSACLLLLFSLFPMAANSTTHAQEMENALQVARRVIENERASAYDDIVPIPASSSTEVLCPSTIRGVATVQKFNYSVDVEEVSSDGPKRVTVKVDWKTGDIDRNFELETMVAPF